MNPERFVYGAEFAPFDSAGGSNPLPSKSLREKFELRRKIVFEARDSGLFKKLTEPQQKVLDALFTVDKIRTYRDIAFERDTTPQAVCEIAQSGLKNLEKLKIGVRIGRGRRGIKLPFENPDKVIASWYLDEGLSTEDISKRLGCSLRTVHRRLRKSGVQLKVGRPKKVLGEDK